MQDRFLPEKCSNNLQALQQVLLQIGGLGQKSSTDLPASGWRHIASSSGLTILKGFLTFGFTFRHLNLDRVSYFWMRATERTNREPRCCGCAEGQSWGLSCALEKQAELPHSRAASARSCCCSAVGREPCWMAEAHWVTANESGVERVRIRLWM